MGTSALAPSHRKVTAVQTATDLEQVNEMLAAGWDLFSTEPYIPVKKDEAFEMVLGPPPKVIFVLAKYES